MGKNPIKIIFFIYYTRNKKIVISSLLLFSILFNNTGKQILFDCRDNNIKSLEGCPEYVGGDFNCYRNPVYSVVQYIAYREGGEKIDNLIELFNYYDIIQDMNVIYDRLKYFYEGIGVEVTDNMLNDIEDNGYKILY